VIAPPRPERIFLMEATDESAGRPRRVSVWRAEEGPGSMGRVVGNADPG
jgi:hypothetical protein